MGFVDEVKSVAQIARDAGNLPLYGRLLDLQREAIEMQEQLAELRAENRRLSEDLARRSELSREGDKYYLTQDDGQREGPICYKCYVGSGNVSMLTAAHGRVGTGYGIVHTCKHCKAQY
ncbi:MAG: hypothetical protein AAGU73_09740 [Actinomycetota bacterium]